jgi:hypothetical protein
MNEIRGTNSKVADSASVKRGGHPAGAGIRIFFDGSGAVMTAVMALDAIAYGHPTAATAGAVLVPVALAFLCGIVGFDFLLRLALSDETAKA